MKKAEKVEKVDLSKLPPELADTVLAFRAELIKERQEQEQRLREALDHFKRELAGLKREAEIEVATQRRLMEIFSNAWGMAAPVPHVTS